MLHSVAGSILIVVALLVVSSSTAAGQAGPVGGRDPNPTYLGDSIGHWEGDTLVVDVVGFNDRTWLDQDGHPHT